MSKRAAVRTIILGLSLVVWGCSNRPKELKNAEELARAACEKVGSVSRAAPGAKGAPIIILEENHVSRAGQIQHAITLVRLHKRGLKHIALEGYLQGRPEIKTDWFSKAAPGQDTDRTSVAVSLLKEGEIGSAEFLKLVYDEVQLHPSENKQQYAVERDEIAARAPTLYLARLAQAALQPAQAERVRQLNQASAALQGEAQQQKVNEMLDYLISANSWTQAKARLLRDPQAGKDLSAEQMLGIEEEIKQRAEAAAIPFAPNERAAMERSLGFWRARVAASETMVRYTSELANRKDLHFIVLIVGAAHTEGIVARLKAAQRPFAVVTPLSLKNDERAGDLTEEMLERRYNRLSVYSAGLADSLRQAFPAPTEKRPEPALLEPAFQAKAEIYGMTDKIVHALLGPPKPPKGSGGGPPPPGGPPISGGPPPSDEPPWGFSENHFDGKWVYIEPRRIVKISDTEDDKRQAVLFPVTLKTPGAGTPKMIYVKATLGNADVSSRERADVEAMLQKTLQEVQVERAPKPAVEDKAGRVQISLDTVAAFAATQEAAKKVRVGS